MSRTLQSHSMTIDAMQTVSVALLTALLLTIMAACVTAAEAIPVDGSEAGLSLSGHFALWHDPSARATLEEAVEALDGLDVRATDAGSTGLQQGAFWSHFTLQNTTMESLDVRLEYIDHQVIYLRAFQAEAGTGDLRRIADLALDAPFSSRPVAHHRFVIPATLPPGQSVEFYVQYGSHQMGFVFPELRIWSPDALLETQTQELALVTFLVGGLAVMAVMAIIGGIATRARYYFTYALHALASIAVWFTVFGFTHQFLLQDNYHWRYMSLFGALTLLTGLLFARGFLNSRKHLPRLDWVLLFLVVNSTFLFFSALLEQTALSVISITLALLLYPVVSLAGAIRWAQGAAGAGLFTIAWTFTVVGLFMQALRDLGFVEHNLVNYYWPAVASVGEMIVIIAAMALRIVDLRRQKEAAERGRIRQLEESRRLLETEVSARTEELAAAKTAAEIEARTDALTGIQNRRSFMRRGQLMLDRCRREKTAVSFMMFDIDHFKIINDENGHATGDQALVSFAKEVQVFLRERDLFGRIGGEEFAVMFVSKPEAAEATAERVRQQVQRLELNTERGTLRFTTSIGIAHMRGEELLEPLIKRADEALYQAKRKGRNQVVVASSGDSGSTPEGAESDNAPLPATS